MEFPIGHSNYYKDMFINVAKVFPFPVFSPLHLERSDFAFRLYPRSDKLRDKEFAR